MKLNEDLRENDLKDVVMPMISFDEFKPKTGDKEKVVTIGFYVTEKAAGKDLGNYLSSSSIEFRDIDVSPNPNEDGFYMVFAEVDRAIGLEETLRNTVKEVTRLSGDMDWKVSLYLSDDMLDLSSDSISEYIIEDPDNYVTKEEFQENKRMKEEEAAYQQKISAINEFFSGSNASDVFLENDVLTIKDYKYTVSLTLEHFGPGKPTLEEAGLSELAIDSDFDYSLMKQLSSIQGSLSIVPINKHVVFHNAESDQVLIAKPR